MRARHILLFVMMLGGCAVESAAEEPEGASAAELSRRIPIKGDFYPVSYKGSVGGKPIERSYTSKELTSFNITDDGLGNSGGSIVGKKSCSPTLSEAGDPAQLRGSRVLNLVEGVVALISIAADLSSFRCRAGTATTERQAVFEKGGLFDNGDYLPSNVGVAGEPKDTKSGDAECRALKSVRYVNFGFDGSAQGCMGFVDGAATTMKILIVRKGTIELQRIVLRRNGS